MTKLRYALQVNCRDFGEYETESDVSFRSGRSFPSLYFLTRAYPHPLGSSHSPLAQRSLLKERTWVPPTGVGQEEVLRLLGMAPAHMDGRWRIKAPIPSSLV